MPRRAKKTDDDLNPPVEHKTKSKKAASSDLAKKFKHYEGVTTVNSMLILKLNEQLATFVCDLDQAYTSDKQQFMQIWESKPIIKNLFLGLPVPIGTLNATLYNVEVDPKEGHFEIVYYNTDAITLLASITLATKWGLDSSVIQTMFLQLNKEIATTERIQETKETLRHTDLLMATPLEEPAFRIPITLQAPALSAPTALRPSPTLPAPIALETQAKDDVSIKVNNESINTHLNVSSATEAPASDLAVAPNKNGSTTTTTKRRASDAPILPNKAPVSASQARLFNPRAPRRAKLQANIALAEYCDTSTPAPIVVKSEMELPPQPSRSAHSKLETYSPDVFTPQIASVFYNTSDLNLAFLEMTETDFPSLEPLENQAFNAPDTDTDHDKNIEVSRKRHCF